MALQTDNIKLDNKIILITGAGDGIGKAVAIECAGRGATIILLGKTVKKLEKTYDEIIAIGGPVPAIYPMDLEGAQAQDYEDLRITLQHEFGHLDGLLHNAGWLGASSPIAQYDAELWFRIMQINLNAVFLLSKACIPLLTGAEHASVVFNVDQKNSAYWGAYGVAKAGQLSLMQILADELENRGVSVNAIDPGAVRSNLRTRAYPGENPQDLPMPDQVAPAYAYLLSDAVTGTSGKVFGMREFNPDTDS